MGGVRGSRELSGIKEISERELAVAKSSGWKEEKIELEEFTLVLNKSL